MALITEWSRLRSVCDSIAVSSGYHGDHRQLDVTCSAFEKVAPFGERTCGECLSVISKPQMTGRLFL